MPNKTVGIFPLTVAAVSQAATVYSDPMLFRKATGDIAILVTIAGTTSITITQQCSLDGITFYDPTDASGNALGAVIATSGAATKYISYSPVLANYIRYKVVENNTGAATVTIKVVSQEEI